MVGSNSSGGMNRDSRAAQVDSLAGFRPQRGREEGPEIPSGLLRAARKSGQLNLSGRGLKLVPPDVYRLDVDVPPESRHDVSFGASERWWDHNDMTKLLLSSNQITWLDSDIRLLPALLTLDLHDNHLASLPEAIGELQQLRQLRLSQNRLSLVPVQLFSLPCLQNLTLQKNQLESLPEELANLTRLTHLDVSSNQLGVLPSSLGCLESLLDLNVSHNRLSRLPLTMDRLLLLRSLDVSENLLEELPDLSALTHLETFHLRRNKLRFLPRLLPPNLKELYLGNNQLDSEGVEPLTGHTHLSALELRANRLTSVPPGVAALRTLTRLDLADNDISTLPPVMGLLPELKVLLLEGNPLRRLRRDVLTKGTQEVLMYLRGRIEVDPKAEPEQTSGLVFSSETPLNAESLRTLKLLDFSDRKAAAVPDDVFVAATGRIVTAVNFSKNQLTCVPERLSDFSSSLVDVNLGFNRLTSCSETLCSFLQLTHLDLRNNQLSVLPPDMRNLNKLSCVNLQVNRFRSFPEVLYLLDSLETVVLGNNKVQVLDPAGLQKLVKLTCLDLSNNDLVHIPPELGLCTSLRRLLLDGNPFRTPRPAVLAKGTESVLEYLRSRIADVQPDNKTS